MPFTGQRIRWIKDPQSESCIDISQEKAKEELEEIQAEKNTKEDLTMYRSLLGQISLLHSRTQFQCCYKFSRCVLKAASPTIGDVKALSNLERKLKSPSETSVMATHRTVENNWIS